MSGFPGLDAQIAPFMRAAAVVVCIAVALLAWWLL